MTTGLVPLVTGKQFLRSPHIGVIGSMALPFLPRFSRPEIAQPYFPNFLVAA